MSMITSAVGSWSEGMTSWKMGKEQWHQAKRQMYYKQVQSAQEVRDMENELAELGGTQRTRYAASGVKTTEGSPMDVMLETERRGKLAIEEKKFWDQAAIREIRKGGRLAKKAGNMALISGAFLGSGKAAGAGFKVGAGLASGKYSGEGGTWSLLGDL